LSAFILQDLLKQIQSQGRLFGYGDESSRQENSSKTVVVEFRFVCLFVCLFDFTPYFAAQLG